MFSVDGTKVGRMCAINLHSQGSLFQLLVISVLEGCQDLRQTHFLLYFREYGVNTSISFPEAFVRNSMTC